MVAFLQLRDILWLVSWFALVALVVRSAFGRGRAETTSPERPTAGARPPSTFALEPRIFYYLDEYKTDSLYVQLFGGATQVEETAVTEARLGVGNISVGRSRSRKSVDVGDGLLQKYLACEQHLLLEGSLRREVDDYERRKEEQVLEFQTVVSRFRDELKFRIPSEHQREYLSMLKQDFSQSRVRELEEFAHHGSYLELGGQFDVIEEGDGGRALCLEHPLSSDLDSPVLLKVVLGDGITQDGERHLVIDKRVPARCMGKVVSWDGTGKVLGLSAYAVWC